METQLFQLAELSLNCHTCVIYGLLTAVYIFQRWSTGRGVASPLYRHFWKKKTCDF